MEKVTSSIAPYFLVIVGFVLIYYVFLGITQIPWEGDSLAYHIPIAHLILDGSILETQDFVSRLFFYPASSESLLAAMMLFGLPLNLFNVFGWVTFFIVLMKLGGAVLLDKKLSIIFAASIILLPSVLRLLPTQTVDIWIAVFFSWSLLLLLKPQKSLFWHIFLGISLGMLIGTKYSGPFLAAILLIIFFPRPSILFSVKSIVTIICLFLTGGLWYLRNWISVNNPFYPGSLFFFEGDPTFKLQNWTPLKTLFSPGGVFSFAQALVSEFILWPFLILGVFIILLMNKKAVSTSLFRLFLLGAICFGLYLFSPSWPENIVSDLRYLYPSVIPFVLGGFMVGKTAKKTPELAVISLLMCIMVLAQVDYYPKLFFLYGILVTVFVYFKNLKHL